MASRPSLIYKPDIDFEKELFEAAVELRGTVAPADYKHYVLPLLFLRYLSLRYEQRRQELQRLIREPDSEYYIRNGALAEEVAEDIIDDPDEYRKVNAFMIPEEATWDYLRRNARADDIKIKLDSAMERCYLDLTGEGFLPSTTRENLRCAYRM